MNLGKWKPSGVSVEFDASRGVLAGLDVAARDANRRVPVGDAKFAGSGDLRDSQVVTVDGNRGALAYKDRGAVGAHERTDVRPAGGKERKFLESAMNGNREAILQAIAEDLRRQLR